MGGFLFYIATGSGVGSITRFSISHLFHQHKISFTVGTFISNVLSCLLTGIFYSILQHSEHLLQEIRYIGIGEFCRSFTTFSSFAYENITYVQYGNYKLFIFYFLLSSILGLASVIIGIKLT